MNWVGGARSRVAKIQGDKRRQKEFFERKKLDLKCERARTSGNNKQMPNKSQDLVAVESFGSTSRRHLFRGTPGDSNVRHVDLDKPCRGRALSSTLPHCAARKVERVELPFSPDHLPSRLHLVESQAEIGMRKNLQQREDPSHTSNVLREDGQLLDQSAIFHRPTVSLLSHEASSARPIHGRSPPGKQTVVSAHAATNNSPNRPQSGSPKVSATRKRHLLRPSRGEELFSPATKQSGDFLPAASAALFSPAAVVAAKVKAARSVENTRAEGGPGDSDAAAVGRFPRHGTPGLTNFWIREEEEEERLRQAESEAESEAVKRQLSPWIQSDSHATLSGGHAAYSNIQARRAGSQSGQSGSPGSCPVESFQNPSAQFQCCRSARFQQLRVCHSPIARHSPISDMATKPTHINPDQGRWSWDQKSEASGAETAWCGRRQDTSLPGPQRPIARGLSAAARYGGPGPDRTPLQELLLVPEDFQPSPLSWRLQHLKDPTVTPCLPCPELSGAPRSTRDVSPPDNSSPAWDHRRRRAAGLSRSPGGEDSSRRAPRPGLTPPCWHSAELARVGTPLLDWWGHRSQSDSETFIGPRAKNPPAAQTLSGGPRAESQGQSVVLRKQRAEQYCLEELQSRTTLPSPCWDLSRPIDACQPLGRQLDLIETSLRHGCTTQGCTKQRLSQGEDHIVPECGYISLSSAPGGKSRPIVKTPSIRQRSVSYQSRAEDTLKELEELEDLTSPETHDEVLEPAMTSAVTNSGNRFISTLKTQTPKSDRNGEPPLPHNNRLKHSAITPTRTQNKRVERKLQSEESESRDCKPPSTTPGSGKTQGHVSASEQLQERVIESASDLTAQNPAPDRPSLAVADAEPAARASLRAATEGGNWKEEASEELPSLRQSPEPESDPDGSQRRLEVSIVVQDLVHRVVMLCSASSSSCRGPPSLSHPLTPAAAAGAAASTVGSSDLAAAATAGGLLLDPAATGNPAQNQVSPSPPAQPVSAAAGGNASLWSALCGLRTPDLFFPAINEVLDRAKLSTESAVDEESAPAHKDCRTVHVQTDWGLTEQWLEELRRSGKPSQVDVGIQWQTPTSSPGAGPCWH